jgi:hypothetical protein
MYFARKCDNPGFPNVYKTRYYPMEHFCPACHEAATNQSVVVAPTVTLRESARQALMADLAG